jgi:DNA repair exonuclease SbcCD ATPase subunit
MNELDLFIIKQITGKTETDVQKVILRYEEIVSKLPVLEKNLIKIIAERNSWDSELTKIKAEHRTYEDLTKKIKNAEEDYRTCEVAVQKKKTISDTLKKDVRLLEEEKTKTKKELSQLESKKESIIAKNQGIQKSFDEDFESKRTAWSKKEQDVDRREKRLIDVIRQYNARELALDKDKKELQKIVNRYNELNKGNQIKMI